MRAVFVGDGSLLVRCAQAWQEAGHQVVRIASHDAAIEAWSQSQALPFTRLELDARPALAAGEFDYLFSVANLTLLPDDLIAQAGRLAVNFHDGPLPRYAGLNATNWAIMAGETRHAVTWHEMTSRVDAGRIVRQASFDLAPGETALSLNTRCHEAGLASFVQIARDAAAGELALTPQTGAGSYFSRDKRPALLGTLDLERPAREVGALVRSLDFGNYANPLARAKLYLGDELLLVRGAQVLSTRSSGMPGTLIRVDADTLTVAARDGDVLLTGVTTFDGRPPARQLSRLQRLPPVPDAAQAALSERSKQIGRGEQHWSRVLATLAPVELPYPRAHALTHPGTPAHRVPVHARLCGAQAVAAFCAWTSALTGRERVSVMFSDAQLSATALAPWLTPWVPLTLATPPGASVHALVQSCEQALAGAHEAGPMTCDLPLRLGEKRPALEAVARVAVSFAGNELPPGCEVMLAAGSADASGKEIELVADARVFARETVELMAVHLGAWLRAFACAQGRLADIPLAPAAEVQAIAQVNATATAYDGDACVHEVVSVQATRTPQKEAVCFREQSLSYREIEERATQVAAWLLERGVVPGDIVGICMERGPELVIAVLAIMKTGAAYLPLDPEYPPERIAFMIEDSQTRLIIGDAAHAASLALPPGRTLLFDEQPQAAGVPPKLPVVDSDSPAYVIYTSGSTGRPKGVVVTHRNVINFFAGMDPRIPHEAGGRWLAVTSLSFDISVLELFWTLSRGFTVVLHPNTALRASVAEQVTQNAVTHLQCTPSMASMLVADAAGRAALSRLSVLMVGGEALPLKLAKELRALVPGKFLNMYGPTETTIWSTTCELADIGDFIGLGQPIANTRLAVRTPWGSECPALVPGELLIGGDGVARGYWKRPELTADRFIGDASQPGPRMYRTGDLVRRHPDGALEFLGRMDHQVKIRGHRIELGEIESALTRQAGVKDAVVVARDDSSGDKRLAAYVTAKTGAVPDAEQILRSLAQELPQVMVPTALVVLQAMPLTPNGKVDRKALPEPSYARLETGQPYIAPRTPTEETVAAIWSTVLGAPRVSIEDNFFDLGGHSLLLLQMHALLCKKLDPELPLVALLQYPTIRLLARHLSGASSLGGDHEAMRSRVNNQRQALARRRNLYGRA